MSFKQTPPHNFTHHMVHQHNATSLIEVLTCPIVGPFILHPAVSLLLVQQLCLSILTPYNNQSTVPLQPVHWKALLWQKQKEQIVLIPHRKPEVIKKSNKCENPPCAF